MQKFLHFQKRKKLNVNLGCFVGFTLFAYVKIESISNHHFTGYISSMVRNVDYYGSVISGYQQKLVYVFMSVNGSKKTWNILELPGTIIRVLFFRFQVYGNGTYYFLITQQLTFPTDWIRLTVRESLFFFFLFSCTKILNLQQHQINYVLLSFWHRNL